MNGCGGCGQSQQRDPVAVVRHQVTLECTPNVMNTSGDLGIYP